MWKLHVHFAWAGALSSCKSAHKCFMQVQIRAHTCLVPKDTQCSLVCHSISRIPHRLLFRFQAHDVMNVEFSYSSLSPSREAKLWPLHPKNVCIRLSYLELNYQLVEWSFRSLLLNAGCRDCDVTSAFNNFCLIILFFKLLLCHFIFWFGAFWVVGTDFWWTVSQTRQVLVIA